MIQMYRIIKLVDEMNTNSSSAKLSVVKQGPLSDARKRSN